MAAEAFAPLDDVAVEPAADASVAEAEFAAVALVFED